MESSSAVVYTKAWPGSGQDLPNVQLALFSDDPDYVSLQQSYVAQILKAIQRVNVNFDRVQASLPPSIQPCSIMACASIPKRTPPPLNSTYLSHPVLSPSSRQAASLSPAQDSRRFRNPCHDDTAPHPASSSALPCDTRGKCAHYALRRKRAGAVGTHSSTSARDTLSFFLRVHAAAVPAAPPPEPATLLVSYSESLTADKSSTQSTTPSIRPLNHPITPSRSALSADETRTRGRQHSCTDARDNGPAGARDAGVQCGADLSYAMVDAPARSTLRGLASGILLVDTPRFLLRHQLCSRDTVPARARRPAYSS
ncbi:hypothetical protein HYPSUDRAFT_210157 [Hypholoma sublateritium FD-334 SS-4]|uniref:Uncharacterized protein n=1 Tax=Hypholoma sublateritium (strain FD-334 SS-4) TaxID=945553 RepID=A0A0D2N0Q1_HYPSF|nr:hypothetical protein HYPSUDRAFT_210157 [Hypholoma sublateritium FD-334 SS-4]